jgi:hypothetical protein
MSRTVIVIPSSPKPIDCFSVWKLSRVDTRTARESHKNNFHFFQNKETV